MKIERSFFREIVFVLDHLFNWRQKINRLIGNSWKEHFEWHNCIMPLGNCKTFAYWILLNYTKNSIDWLIKLWFPKAIKELQHDRWFKDAEDKVLIWIWFWSLSFVLLRCVEIRNFLKHLNHKLWLLLLIFSLFIHISQVKKIYLKNVVAILKTFFFDKKISKYCNRKLWP